MPERPYRLCCVGDRVAWRLFAGGESDGQRQVIEGSRDSMLDRYLRGYVVVAASEVLDERLTGSKDPC
jgi:hypothetical protein